MCHREDSLSDRRINGRQVAMADALQYNASLCSDGCKRMPRRFFQAFSRHRFRDVSWGIPIRIDASRRNGAIPEVPLIIILKDRLAEEEHGPRDQTGSEDQRQYAAFRGPRPRLASTVQQGNQHACKAECSGEEQADQRRDRHVDHFDIIAEAARKKGENKGPPHKSNRKCQPNPILPPVAQQC
jgi:hypothetical protein